MASTIGEQPTDERTGGENDAVPLRKPLEGMAFWSAVTFPFVPVSLLATGLESRSTATAFAVLFAVDVVALVSGHRYRRE